MNLFCGSLQYTEYKLHINDIIKSRPKIPGLPLEKISGYATGMQGHV